LAATPAVTAHVTDEALKKLTDPSNYLGVTQALIDNVIK